MAFAVVTIFYSVVSMYVIRRPSASVELGFNKTRTRPIPGKNHGILVLDAAPASPAERAGCTPATVLWGSMANPSDVRTPRLHRLGLSSTSLWRTLPSPRIGHNSCSHASA